MIKIAKIKIEFEKIKVSERTYFAIENMSLFFIGVLSGISWVFIFILGPWSILLLALAFPLAIIPGLFKEEYENCCPWRHGYGRLTEQGEPLDGNKSELKEGEEKDSRQERERKAAIERNIQRHKGLI